MHPTPLCTMVDTDKIVMYPNVADSLRAYAVTLTARRLDGPRATVADAEPFLVAAARAMEIDTLHRSTPAWTRHPPSASSGTTATTPWRSRLAWRSPTSATSRPTTGSRRPASRSSASPAPELGSRGGRPALHEPPDRGHPCRSTETGGGPPPGWVGRDDGFRCWDDEVSSSRRDSPAGRQNRRPRLASLRLRRPGSLGPARCPAPGSAWSSVWAAGTLAPTRVGGQVRPRRRRRRRAGSAVEGLERSTLPAARDSGASRREG